MQLLTKNQQLVLDILKEFIKSNNKSPTLSELQTELIANGISAKSKRSVVQYLESLEVKNYIFRNSADRWIRIINQWHSKNLVSIPVFGTTSAWSALAFTEDNINWFIKLSKKLLKSVDNIFALQVSWDSMNKCQINGNFIENGDYVVIDRNTTNILNNDVVLAVIEWCATIKRLKKSNQSEIILMPESMNPVHQPIYIHESDTLFINGKVISVLKNGNNL